MKHMYSECEFAVWCRELRPGALWQLRGKEWGEGEVQERGDICIPTADSCWYREKLT